MLQKMKDKDTVTSIEGLSQSYSKSIQNAGYPINTTESINQSNTFKMAPETKKKVPTHRNSTNEAFSQQTLPQWVSTSSATEERKVECKQDEVKVETRISDNKKPLDTQKNYCNNCKVLQVLYEANDSPWEVSIVEHVTSVY